MTTIAQVTALVDAHVSRDLARFRAITLQIAAHTSGHGAEQLRKLVELQPSMRLTPLPNAAGLLSVMSTLASLDDMVLAPSIRERLDRILLEQARRDDLRVRGLWPARKLLFTGPPGVGKGMGAGALARALELPLFRVDLHSVIASHLGETASKLAQVFESVRAVPAVYLFDEFDALSADRSSVGGEAAGAEMRRVVNSLLQFLEDDRSDGLLIAATNHAQMLDSAIFRRFDETISFEPLTATELTTLIERAMQGFLSQPLDYSAIYTANPKLGHADLCAVLDRVRKDQVLTGAEINTACLVEGIRRRSSV
jgi:SpoVK/Ycf46/Vps4 family AAA+-type ATPase